MSNEVLSLESNNKAAKVAYNPEVHFQNYILKSFEDGWYGFEFDDFLDFLFQENDRKYSVFYGKLSKKDPREKWSVALRYMKRFLSSLPAVSAGYYIYDVRTEEMLYSDVDGSIYVMDGKLVYIFGNSGYVVKANGSIKASGYIEYNPNYMYFVPKVLFRLANKFLESNTRNGEGIRLNVGGKIVDGVITKYNKYNYDSVLFKAESGEERVLSLLGSGYFKFTPALEGLVSSCGLGVRKSDVLGMENGLRLMYPQDCGKTIYKGMTYEVFTGSLSDDDIFKGITEPDGLIMSCITQVGGTKYTLEYFDILRLIILKSRSTSSCLYKELGFMEPDISNVEAWVYWLNEVYAYIKSNFAVECMDMYNFREDYFINCYYSEGDVDCFEYDKKTNSIVYKYKRGIDLYWSTIPLTENLIFVPESMLSARSAFLSKIIQDFVAESGGDFSCKIGSFVRTFDDMRFVVKKGDIPTFTKPNTMCLGNEKQYIYGLVEIEFAKI